MMLPLIMFGQIRARAQRSDTVFVQLASVASPSTTYEVPSSSMIGQGSHQAWVTYGLNKPGFTCTPGTTFFATFSIQGSFDEVNWVTFSTTGITSSQTPFVGYTTGQGLYPFVRVSVTNNLTAACAYNLFYSGGVPSVSSAVSTITGASYNANNISNLSNNGAGLTEKGNRYQMYNAGAAQLTAPSLTGFITIIDCVSLTLTATADITTGDFATVTTTNSVVSGHWGVSLGLPTGAPVGTVVHRDACGLNLTASTAGAGAGDIGFTWSKLVANATTQTAFTYYYVKR